MRIEDVWTQLIALSKDTATELQIIVAANDVPGRVRDFVRLTLSAEDRLVPEADLEREG